MDPYRFWERQKDNANVTSPGYSYNSLFGKMILTVTDAGVQCAGSVWAGGAGWKLSVCAVRDGGGLLWTWCGWVRRL